MPSSSFNLSNPSLPDRALAERRIAVLFVTNLSDDLMPPRGAAVSVRRKRKPSEFHSEVTRERIRAAVIIDRFQKHFMGELDLTPTQIRVGEILLRKVIPDLTHTDLSATFTRRYVVEVPAQLSDEEWEKKYSLPARAPTSVQ